MFGASSSYCLSLLRLRLSFIGRCVAEADALASMGCTSLPAGAVGADGFGPLGGATQMAVFRRLEQQQEGGLETNEPGVAAGAVAALRGEAEGAVASDRAAVLKLVWQVQQDDRNG